MSGLLPLLGHESVRKALAAAALRRDLAPALLFIGPTGVGKQRTALWLVQLLLCDAPSVSSPCESCRHCRLVNRLEHPDVHWFFPLPRPRVSGPDRLGEALEDARAAELESRRSGSWSTTPSDEPAGIYLAHAQIIRRIAIARPAMARHKAIIIGDAEQLVPQEASPEAANALLKLLEEPPSDTTIVVTASDPHALLPTIRSRLLPVRFARLPDTTVLSGLEAMKVPVPHDRIALVARLAQGSIGRAAGFVDTDGGPGPLEVIRRRAREILEGVLSGGSHPYAVALAQAPYRARGDFATTLEFIAAWLRDLAAVGAGMDDAVINVDSLDWLRERAGRFADGRAVADAISGIDEILGLTKFNINPQLALRGAVRRIAERASLQPAVPG